MAKLIGNIYSLSIFEAGLELNKIDEFQSELDFVEKVFKNNAKLFEILKHPMIDRVEKKNIIEELFKGKISQELVNLLFVLIDKNRESHLFEIISEFYKRSNEYNNIANIKVVTAVPMKEEAIGKLTNIMEVKLNKNVKLSNKVDKSIIGGVLLQMDNRFIDTTIRSQLKEMELAIKGASL